MTTAACYLALATLLEYPRDRDRMLQSLNEVTGHLEAQSLEAVSPRFIEFLQRSTLTDLQEDYVSTFDFNPVRAPYLGHHLYGDHQRRSTYLITLKRNFANHGFSPEGCELPDHLSVLARFLAHLAKAGEDGPRRRFLEQAVLPGLRKMTSRPELNRPQWLPLFEVAEHVMTNDCREESPCSISSSS